MSCFFDKKMTITIITLIVIIMFNNNNNNNSNKNNKVNAQSTHQWKTRMQKGRCLRISGMRPAFGYSSGKVKGQGIETFSGSRV